MLKAFYGRYYNNLADGFSGVNPGGQNYNEYNFNDLNHNGKYDGPQELGALAHAHRRRRVARAREHEDAAHRRVQRHVGTPVLGRVVDSRHLRAEDAEGLRAVLLLADGHGVAGPADGADDGELSRDDVQPARRAERVSPMPTGTEYTNYPDSDFTYDTIELAFSKRIGARSSSRRSGDYQWRNELRSAESANELTHDPAGDRSDWRVSAFLTVESERAESAEDDDVPRAGVGSLHLAVRHRARAELPLPERLPVLADRAGRLSGPERVQLQLRVLHAEPRSEPVGERQPDELPHRQIYPDWQPRSQGDGDARHLQPAERRPGYQLQPGRRTYVLGA